MEKKITPPSLIVTEDMITITIVCSPSTMAAQMKIDKSIGVPLLIAFLASIMSQVATDALQQSQMIVGAGAQKEEEAKDGNDTK